MDSASLVVPDAGPLSTAPSSFFGRKTTAAQIVSGQDLTGKNILVTGGNSGVGLETARACAEAGATVIMGCRSLVRGQAAAADISATTGKTVQVRELDVSKLESVRAFADQYIASGAHPHVLVNNAGIGNYGGTSGAATTTVEGWDMIFATNYIGPFLLTHLLMPVMRRSAPARVVNVSSIAGEGKFPFEIADMPYTTEGQVFERYSQSKFAQTLHAAELQKRESANGVSAFSLHPGVIKTAIWNNAGNPCLVGCISCLFAMCSCFRTTKSIEAGAATQTVCAVTAGIEAQGGAFFDDCVARPHKRSAEAQEKQVALFEATNRWLGLENS